MGSTLSTLYYALLPSDTSHSWALCNIYTIQRFFKWGNFHEISQITKIEPLEIALIIESYLCKIADIPHHQSLVLYIMKSVVPVAFSSAVNFSKGPLVSCRQTLVYK